MKIEEILKNRQSGKHPGIESRSKADVERDLYQVLNRVFFAVIRVDLLKDRACILQSSDYPDYVSLEVVWNDYLKGYGRFVAVEDLEDFTAEHLLEQHNQGQDVFSKELAYNQDGIREWLTMEAYMDFEGGFPCATVIVKKSSSDHLRKKIIDMYVYNSCDFFLYLDAKNDSCTRFCGTTDGTPLPPAVCKCYSSEHEVYINEHVVPEDRDKAIYEMNLKRVLEKLEENQTHSFSCGVCDPKRGYTRKRLEYRYYDRNNQMILLSCIDITDMYLEEQEKQKELQQALRRAQTDSLTKLLNRQGILNEISYCLMEEDEKSALLFIDLDNFKKVNDTLGHMEGDKLLRRVAVTIRAGVRSSDLVGRIGGDEFLIYLRNINSREEILACANRLCNAVGKLSITSGFPVSCSVGVSVFPEDGSDYSTLVKVADSRAYHAKANGKNQVSL